MPSDFTNFVIFYQNAPDHWQSGSSCMNKDAVSSGMNDFVVSDHNVYGATLMPMAPCVPPSIIFL